MKKLVLFLSLFLFGIQSAFAASKGDFEKLFPVLTKESKVKEITPKTTEELRQLFENSDKELPRVFIKNLPADFSEKGDKKLYAKVIAALVLRENETILNERILFLLLKDKADKGSAWTKQEEAYFNYLVNKYDSSVLKTIPTKINDLLVKIDEIPPSLAIAQTAFDTNFGKKNPETPFGQMGWLDGKTYAPIPYKTLSDAVKAYVLEMNSTPNYDDWRLERENQTYQQNQRSSYYMTSGLRTYRPEDVDYIEKIKILMNQNPFIFDMDKIPLKAE